MYTIQTFFSCFFDINRSHDQKMGKSFNFFAFILPHYINGLIPIWEELSLPNAFIGVELNGVGSIPGSNNIWMHILPQSNPMTNNCARFSIANDGNIHNIINIYQCFTDFIEGYSQRNEFIYFVSDMKVYQHNINFQNTGTSYMNDLFPSSPRHGYPCVAIDGSYLFITGGYDSINPRVGVGYYIKVDWHEFISVVRPSMNQARFGHGCLVNNDNVIVFGGYKTENNFVDMSMFMGMKIYMEYTGISFLIYYI